MNAFDQSLMQEIDKLFDSNWEEFYENEKVRTIYQEVRDLADVFCAGKVDGKDLTNMFGKLQELKKELDEAINEARTIRQEQTRTDINLQETSVLRALAKEAHQTSRWAKYESVQSELKAVKAAKVSKLSMVASVLVILLTVGGQGYLYLQGQGADDSIKKHLNSSFKTTLKNEIAQELAAQVSSAENPQFTTLGAKDMELDTRLSSFEAQLGKISELEIKTSQFAVELEKNANLRGRISELEHSIKMSRSTASLKPSKAAKASKTSKTKSSPKKSKSRR